MYQSLRERAEKVFVVHFFSFCKKMLQFFETSGSQPRLIFTFLVALTSRTFECEQQKVPACKRRRHYTFKMYHVMCDTVISERYQEILEEDMSPFLEGINVQFEELSFQQDWA
jgi:hypothetical protein